MQRIGFLKAGLSLAALVAIPFSLYAKSREKKRIEKGFMVGAGKDRFGKNTTPFDGDTFFCKVSTKDTDGDLYVFESTSIAEPIVSNA